MDLTDHAARVPTTRARATAGRGAPCEHPGCDIPWTAYTVLGPRCDTHKRLDPAAIPVIRDADRWTPARCDDGHTTTLSRGTTLPAASDVHTAAAHRFDQDPGRHRGLCKCGRGIRAFAHRDESEA